MVKIIPILFLFALCSCTGTSPYNAGNSSVETTPRSGLSYPHHWVTLPQPGNLVVVGLSGRQLTTQAEIDIAHEDAARKVAMYYGMQVTLDIVQNIGSGFLDYYTASNINIEYDQELEKYIDKLVHNPERDVYIGEGVKFIRFTYPAEFSGTISHSPGTADSIPAWTTRRPQNMGDYVVGVGLAARQLRLRDTITKSYEAAAASIVSQHSTTITTSLTEDSETHQNTNVIIRQSTGSLSNFIVLETWIDPDSGAVWTLAAAIPSN